MVHHNRMDTLVADSCRLRGRSDLLWHHVPGCQESQVDFLHDDIIPHLRTPHSTYQGITTNTFFYNCTFGAVSITINIIAVTGNYNFLILFFIFSIYLVS